MYQTVCFGARVSSPGSWWMWNLDSFAFKGNATQTCDAYVAETPNKRCNKNQNGRKVGFFCPVTCKRQVIRRQVHHPNHQDSVLFLLQICQQVHQPNYSIPLRIQLLLLPICQQVHHQVHQSNQIVKHQLLCRQVLQPNHSIPLWIQLLLLPIFRQVHHQVHQSNQIVKHQLLCRQVDQLNHSIPLPTGSF